MKKLLIEIWLGVVSLIAPDPENERTPDEQREAQAGVFLMIYLSSSSAMLIM